MTRFETLFCIRYAARVLERHAKFWRLCNGLVRVFALLSGSAAFAALVAGNQNAAIASGIIFAIFQALEFGVCPAEMAAHSTATRHDYAKLLSSASTIPDAELESAYLEMVAKDNIVVPLWLREIAYNDVLFERGGDPVSAYDLRWLQKFVSRIA